MLSKTHNSSPDVTKKSFGLTKEHYVAWCNQGLGALALLAFLIPQTDIVNYDVVPPPDTPSAPTDSQRK